jgi:preprotein translocase subunit SecD
VNPLQAEVLVVPSGTVVLQATAASASDARGFSDPHSRFYVLSDHVALSGADISNPLPGTDPTGRPSIGFSFTPAGSEKFLALTRTVARRGADVSQAVPLTQHFAVALDDRLLALPGIDFKTYPNGIPGDHGADITGGFTVRSARDIATLLRFGALPVSLVSP